MKFTQIKLFPFLYVCLIAQEVQIETFTFIILILIGVALMANLSAAYVLVYLRNQFHFYRDCLPLEPVL